MLKEGVGMQFICRMGICGEYMLKRRRSGSMVESGLRENEVEVYEKERKLKGVFSDFFGGICDIFGD